MTLQNNRIKIIYFIEEGSSRLSRVWTVNEELRCGFNIMNVVTNWIYAIFKVISQIVII